MNSTKTCGAKQQFRLKKFAPISERMVEQASEAAQKIWSRLWMMASDWSSLAPTVSIGLRKLAELVGWSVGKTQAAVDELLQGEFVSIRGALGKRNVYTLHPDIEPVPVSPTDRGSEDGVSKTDTLSTPTVSKTDTRIQNKNQKKTCTASDASNITNDAQHSTPLADAYAARWQDKQSANTVIGDRATLEREFKARGWDRLAVEQFADSLLLNGSPFALAAAENIALLVKAPTLWQFTPTAPEPAKKMIPSDEYLRSISEGRSETAALFDAGYNAEIGSKLLAQWRTDSTWRAREEKARAAGIQARLAQPAPSKEMLAEIRKKAGF